ncbi:hypothetical protein BV210_14535 [Halorientalis sp. IM1011]|nr:hypothetical protein BV210_14535 [Halorientalis sp. IM1011]
MILGAGVVWYAGSIGVSMGAMAYDDDSRTVVIDAADAAEFDRHYDEDREEGWCLYGTTNETHLRVEEVVHADPVGQGPERVTFTCLPETAGQVLGGDTATLIGTVHSHPGHNESELSKLDIALFGRLSPFVETMGVYTETNGTAYFTTDSMTNPLDTRVVGGADDGGRVGRGERTDSSRSARNLTGSDDPAVRDTSR